MKYSFTLFALLCTASVSLYAQQPGTLDLSFGDSGKVVSTAYEGQSHTSLLQPDGKIIIGGIGDYYRDDKLTSGSLLERYNPDGTPDPSFGDSGKAVYNVGNPNISLIYALARQKDGKIVAAVRGYESFACIRVNTDGSVDKSYGEEGLAMGPEDDSYFAYDMTMLPDGRTVITGDAALNDNDARRSFIACFTAEGRLDKSFGNAGVVSISFDESENTNSIAVTGEGKIIVGGNYNFFKEDFLLCYDKNGIQDYSFGKNGIATMSFESNLYAPDLRNIFIAGNNTIATTGRATFNNIHEAILAGRFLADGTPDSSFGTNGYTVTRYENTDVYASAVVVQPNGKIVVGGDFSQGEFKGGVTMVRYNTDGSMDSSFGVNGITKTVFTGGDVGTSFLLQKDGKIVLSGYSGTKGNKLITTLARYNGDDPGKQPLMVRIRRWLQHHGISWQYNAAVRYYSVQRSTDGGITYREIASVSNKTNSYEDAALPATTNALYRLAAIAKDGSRTYSNTVIIDETQSTRIFPNPVKDNLQLQGLPPSGKTSLSVVDLNGTVRSSATATGTNYSVSTANLSSGSYLLKIQHNGTTVTLPFVKE